MKPSFLSNLKVASLAVVALLVLLAGVSAPVTAQQANVTVNQSTDDPATTYIDDGLRLVDSGYDPDTKQAYIVLDADRPQSVTVSDGGRLSRGSGEIPTENAVVDGETRITVRATEVEGRVAVVIDSENRLYGHIVQNQSTQALIGGPWDATDVQIAAGSAGATVSIVVILQIILYRRGSSHEPERIA